MIHAPKTPVFYILVASQAFVNSDLKKFAKEVFLFLDDFFIKSQYKIESSTRGG